MRPNDTSENAVKKELAKAIERTLTSKGERVVTSGNFLIDSESQMKAAASGMGGMAGMPGMTNEPTKPETPATQPKAPPAKSDAKGMADMPGMTKEPTKEPGAKK